MKKFSLFVFCLLMFTASHSQIQVGAKAGYNLSTFYTPLVSNFYSYSSLSNFNAGIVVAIPMGMGFFAQIESVYSGQGAHVSLSGVSGQYASQYLNFPIMLKFVSHYHIYVETGPQLGFLLGSTLSETGFPTANIKDQTNTHGWSWVFGLGVNLPMNFGLDIRYNLGLTEVPNSNSNAYNDASIKNNVFQVGITYMIPNLLPSEAN
jgi:hypothetical protein